MPPKAKLPAPIDRPLSKAYLRMFTGWATAEPPGVSDPTSLRLMENVLINRDGSVRVRPGLRYLSYATPPSEGVAGVAIDRPLVGMFEPFYLNDGTKAYLQAVREIDLTVGWRVIVTETGGAAVYELEDPDVDFIVAQGMEALNFTEATTYVTYLQIDNKIFALSNAGETMRMFYVGKHKQAKFLQSITRPEWDKDDKLEVLHPEANWITGGDEVARRHNFMKNPSFEKNMDLWRAGGLTNARRVEQAGDWDTDGGELYPEFDTRFVQLKSEPTRKNLAGSPLHDVATTGVAHWNPDPGDASIVVGGGAASSEGGVTLSADGNYMKLDITSPTKGSFFARSKIWEGVEAGEAYQVAFDVLEGPHVNPVTKVRWLGINGARIGDDVVRDVDVTVSDRFASKRLVAPKGAVALRLFLGGENTEKAVTWLKFKDLIVCPADQELSIFTGDSGVDYFWHDEVNNSRSVYHPPVDVKFTSSPMRAISTEAIVASAYIGSSAPREFEFTIRQINKNDQLINEDTTLGTNTAWNAARYQTSIASTYYSCVKVEVQLRIPDVPRGEIHTIDAVMLEPYVTVAGDYFDGDNSDYSLIYEYEWRDEEHASASIEIEYAAQTVIPTKETKTQDTLIATGGHTINIYGSGFFYTFDNEVGESAPSKITEKRTQRPWSDWIWELPDVEGNPSGDETKRARLACDQLVAIMPEDVYNEAISQGATSWSLYMVTWSEQDAAPIAALKVDTRKLKDNATYDTHGWIRVTPETTSAIDEMLLPRRKTIFNYSAPSRAAQGAVVADRMVLVNDPTEQAVIKWSSNRQGEYTNFTAGKGGGYKTLTSGNLNVPVAVKLWQNPQSADTITILCLGTDGYSTAYYMAPATVSSQSDAVAVMGFEETTATPGTTSPLGVEMFNNSLYHPLEDQLMKSTASNYNINHKSQTDMIRNMWERLTDKDKIVSDLHDSRLYYIVTNPDGDPVEDGCNGNEIWVFDAASKTGTWSRWKVQAHSLRRLEFGGHVYMGVTRPDGLFYFDPDYGLDDVVNDTLGIESQPIPWYLETNTQGANRAHDAWCHLQQMSVGLGYFQGRMRFGLKSIDINGKVVDMEKVVKDTAAPTVTAWDIEETLAVRRDVKEWFFYAGSYEDEPSFGQLSLVQYRYTPVSVNVGYEYGSIETFEYGRDVALAGSTVTENGVPLPLLDQRRP